jgi:glycosyltransferase involved in cell wall biosynthesis
LTIAYLLDLWSATRMKTRLLVYGRQKADWPVVPNVTFCGYVEDIGDAYKPGSILVCPSLLAGGIKTKVLEAFGYGVPVVGNGLTFEGILPPGYPLMMECRTDLAALLRDPGSQAEVLMRAARIGSAYLAQEHSAAVFAERWREVVLGHGRDQKTASAARSDDLEYAADEWIESDGW